MESDHNNDDDSGADDVILPIHISGQKKIKKWFERNIETASKPAFSWYYKYEFCFEGTGVLKLKEKQGKAINVKIKGSIIGHNGDDIYSLHIPIETTKDGWDRMNVVTIKRIQG